MKNVSGNLDFFCLLKNRSTVVSVDAPNASFKNSQFSAEPRRVRHMATLKYIGKSFSKVKCSPSDFLCFSFPGHWVYRQPESRHSGKTTISPVGATAGSRNWRSQGWNHTSFTQRGTHSSTGSTTPPPWTNTNTQSVTCSIRALAILNWEKRHKSLKCVFLFV